jgi:hypothetical protein
LTEAAVAKFPDRVPSALTRECARFKLENAQQADTLWSVKDIAEMINAALPKGGKRGPYEKHYMK